MERQMILEANSIVWKRVVDCVKKAANMLNAPMKIMSNYYSYVLERHIDTRQTKAITEAQLAFVATVLPADYNLALRSLACAWFILSLKKCKKLL